MMPKMTTSKTTFYDKKKLSSLKFHHFGAFIILRTNKIFRYTITGKVLLIVLLICDYVANINLCF